MKVSEFKAWFSGFCEGIGGVPSDSQWERIKSKVDEIEPDSKFISPFSPYDRMIGPASDYPYQTWMRNDSVTYTLDETPDRGVLGK